MTTPLDALKDGLAKYFRSEEHSDCTIICGPYHFKVHKLLIGAHSEYFRTALKANTFQEGKTGTIDLEATEAGSDDEEDACDDPEIVKLMIHYFYHLGYLQASEPASDEPMVEDLTSPPPKKKAKKSTTTKRTRTSKPDPPQPAQPAGPNVHLIEHAKVFAMAVKYHTHGLRDLAAQKLQAEAKEHWDHEDLAHAIHVIYTSTADDVTQLREIAAELLNSHSDKLMKKAEIATLLRSINGLAYDLLVRDRNGANNVSNYHRFRKVGIQQVPCYHIEAHAGIPHQAREYCSECGVIVSVCHSCYTQDNRHEWMCLACR